MLLLDFGADLLERRNAVDGIGVEVERQAAIERGLADQQHAAGVAVARGQLAEADQRLGIAVLAHVGEDRDRDLALVELVEQLRGAHDLQPLGAAAARGGRSFSSICGRPSLARASWP